MFAAAPLEAGSSCGAHTLTLKITVSDNSMNIGFEIFFFFFFCGVIPSILFLCDPNQGWLCCLSEASLVSETQEPGSQLAVLLEELCRPADKEPAHPMCRVTLP